jgi:hypothetical protein
MKQQQLQELIRLITRQILKEYSSLSPADEETTSDTESYTDTSTDSLSPIEKQRMEREKDKARRDDIKVKQKELDVAKNKMAYQKQEIDQTKRFNIPDLTKDIQRLKGAKL